MTTHNSSLLQRQPWDLVGIGASSLCVLHCLITPLLVVFLPVLELVEKQTHTAFAVTILAVGLLAFWPGYRRHGRWEICVAAIVGFALISLGVTAPEGILSEPAEMVSTLIGGITLVIAHFYNAFFCRKCRHCGDEACMFD